MTSFAQKYNRNTAIYTYDYPEKEAAVYTNLKELQKTYPADKIYPVFALYISTKGQYGPTPSAAIGKNIICNLPGFMADQITEMRQDAELTDAINEGKFGFRIVEKKKRDGKPYLLPEWLDIELPF